jgi:hypothetical protein
LLGRDCVAGAECCFNAKAWPGPYRFRSPAPVFDVPPPDAAKVWVGAVGAGAGAGAPG